MTPRPLETVPPTETASREPAPSERGRRGEINWIRDELARLRRHLRRLFVWHGSLRLLLEALLLVVATFLADRLFVTPQAARLVQLLGLVVFMGLRFARHIGYPLTRRLSLQELAAAVERRYPVLDGRLVSSLHWSTRQDVAGKDLGGQSVALPFVDQLLTDTAAFARELPFEWIFTTRPIRRYAVACGLLVLLVGGYALSSPEIASVYVSRLLGGSTPWPRSTHLVLEVPAESPNYTVDVVDGSSLRRHLRVSIARGASLPVVVHVEGRVPEEVFLTYAEADSGSREYQMGRRGEGDFFYRLRSIRRDGRLTAHGGDDGGEGRLVELAVRIPPTLTSVEAHLEPPSYTGLAPSVQDTGHIDAPVGTRVTLTLHFNVPLREATLAFDGRHDLARTLEPTADPLVRSASFEVEKSGSYALNLIGEDGFPNLDPIAFSILAINDKVPIVRPLNPGPPDIDVTPRALVLFRCEAEDDYGISSLFLSHQLLGDETAHDTSPYDPATGSGGLSPLLPARRVVAELRWDLTTLVVESGDAKRPLLAGDSVTYLWKVADNAESAGGTPDPHEVPSQGRRIDVVTESEKIRLLTERQVRMKDEVVRLRESQVENLQQVESLVEDGITGDDTRSPAELIRVELDQNRITQRARRLSSELAELFEEYLFNRLDLSSAAERLLQTHLEAKVRSPASESFEASLYRARLDEFAQGLYGEMEVDSKLLTMLGLGLRVSEELSPLAQASLAEARVTLQADRRPELIERARQAQMSLIELLDQLLERMDEWEDFQEVLELTRELVDDQRTINTRYREYFKQDEDSSGK
ncbi:MAG: hypothetical protein AB1486_07345 [Planctomycetota bacterium]